jgi:hypothetical protein
LLASFGPEPNYNKIKIEKSREKRTIGRGERMGVPEHTIPGQNMGYRDARKPPRIPVRACGKAGRTIDAFSPVSAGVQERSSPQSHPTSSMATRVVIFPASVPYPRPFYNNVGSVRSPGPIEPLLLFSTLSSISSLSQPPKKVNPQRLPMVRGSGIKIKTSPPMKLYAGKVISRALFIL